VGESFTPRFKVQEGLNLFHRLPRSLSIKRGDMIYIQRGQTHWLVPELFGSYRKAFKTLLIFDMDDPVYLLYPKETKKICRAVDGVVVASDSLRQYAEKYCKKTFLVPNPVGTDFYIRNEIKKSNQKGPIIIGWVGMASTMPFLEVLSQPLSKLGMKYDLCLHVITGPGDCSDLVPHFENIKIKLIKWDIRTVVEHMNRFDIGVMPLYDNEECRARGAVKSPEYRAELPGQYQ